MLKSLIVRIVLRLLLATIVFAAMLVAAEYALRFWFRHVTSSGNARRWTNDGYAVLFFRAEE